MADQPTAHETCFRILAETRQALNLPENNADHFAFVGDERLPSCFPVSELAAASIGLACLAVSELLALTGTRLGVKIDLRSASLWFGRSIAPTGWQMPGAWDAIAGDYRASDGWIKLHTNAPHHRAAALSVLRCLGTKEAVAEAVLAWSAGALEQAIVDAKGCAAEMRGAVAWSSHPQGMAVATEPLVAYDRTDAAVNNRWQPNPQRPLAGLKVLDLTRVLAGPVATRFLAGYGADVLRIDPPDWDEPGVVPEVTLGKRCARLDLREAGDRVTFERLLADADILVHGYRAGALDALGLDEVARQAIRPGLIDVSLNAYGHSGPWCQRRGFDSLVQMSCGIAQAGMEWARSDKPFPLPVQALDHATGYLMAAAAVRGLIARQMDGRGSNLRLSLARTSKLLIEHQGEANAEKPQRPCDADYAAAIEATDWGSARRARPPAAIDDAPMYWAKPAGALGADEPAWLE